MLLNCKHLIKFVKPHSATDAKISQRKVLKAVEEFFKKKQQILLFSVRSDYAETHFSFCIQAVPAFRRL